MEPITTSTVKPNIVLVHGSWGEGSIWSKVTLELISKGYNVRAVQNLATSLADDVDRVNKLVASLEGPSVLVGHSYGGMIITGAGVSDKVVGLVYIAAFVPDEGESVFALGAMKDPAPGLGHIVPDESGFTTYAIDMFRQNLCPDIDECLATAMAHAQKPTHFKCFQEGSTTPAWKTKPSWYQISANDRMINPELQAHLAARISPKKTITLQSSHCSNISHSCQVVDLIVEASNYNNHHHHA
eukprot:gene12816-15040_t